MKWILFLLVNMVVINISAQLKPVGSGVFRWADLAVKKDGLRESRKIVEGSTPEFEYFQIHATTQQKGAVSKPPHTQKDIEEMIIIKEGTMKCTIGDKTAILGPESVLLIPPLESQTYENIGEGPLTYYVFAFKSKKMNMERSAAAGGSLLINADTLAVKQSTEKAAKKYFERPTAMCENYEMHITYLTHKGPSHAPHQHVETEMILIIDGQTEMTIDGKTYAAGPGDMYIAESGSLHGISNVAEKPCSYFAFKWR